MLLQPREEKLRDDTLRTSAFWRESFDIGCVSCPPRPYASPRSRLDRELMMSCGSAEVERIRSIVKRIVVETVIEKQITSEPYEPTTECTSYPGRGCNMECGGKP